MKRLTLKEYANVEACIVDSRTESQLYRCVEKWEKKVKSPYKGISWDEAYSEAIEKYQKQAARIYLRALRKWERIVDPESPRTSSDLPDDIKVTFRKPRRRKSERELDEEMAERVRQQEEFARRTHFSTTRTIAGKR